MARIARLVGVALVLLVPGVARADLRAAASPTWVPDGTVSSIVPDGARTFIAGDFTQVGPFTGPAALVDAVSGAQASYPKLAAGRVTAAVPDGAGGAYLGGSFPVAANSERARVLHLRSDGSLDGAFRAAIDGSGDIVGLALSGGRLYVAGGVYGGSGPTTRDFLAAVSATTGALDTGFDAQVRLGADYDAPVRAIAAAGGRVYVAQSGGTVGGSATPLLAVDGASGARIAGFAPAANAEVTSLTYGGGRLYARGSFGSIGGAARDGIAQLDPASGRATAWVSQVPGSRITAFDASAGPLWFGGPDPTSPGDARVGVLDPASGVLGTRVGAIVDPRVGAGVLSVSVSGSTVYFGGAFTAVGASPRHRAAAITTSGTLTGWDPDANGTVLALARAGGHVLVGGSFASMKGTARPGVAALDSAAGTLTSWNPSVTGPFGTPRIDHAALAADGQLLLAGTFDSIGGQSRPGLGGVRADTGAVTGFDPGVTPGSFGTGLVPAGSSVYVIADAKISKVALSSGAADPSFVAPALAGTGSTFATDVRPTSAGLLVGGRFTSVNGAPRTDLALVSASTGATLASPRAFPNDTVAALVDAGSGQTLAGGTFRNFGATATPSFTLLDASGNRVTSFAPAAYANGFGGPVASGAGRVLFGGASATANPTLVPRADGSPIAWTPRVGQIESVALAGGQAWVGQSTSGFDAVGPALLRFVDDPSLHAPRQLSAPVLPAVVHVGDRVRCTPARFSGTPTPSTTTTIGAPSGSSTSGELTLKASDLGRQMSCYTSASNPAATIGSSFILRTVQAAAASPTTAPPTAPPAPVATAPATTTTPGVVTRPTDKHALALRDALALARRSLSVRALRRGIVVRTPSTLRRLRGRVTRAARPHRTIATTLRVRGRLTLRATAAGRRLLRRGLRVTVTVSARDRGGRAVSRHATLRLKR